MAATFRFGGAIMPIFAFLYIWSSEAVGEIQHPAQRRIHARAENAGNHAAAARTNALILRDRRFVDRLIHVEQGALSRNQRLLATREKALNRLQQLQSNGQFSQIKQLEAILNKTNRILSQTSKVLKKGVPAINSNVESTLDQMAKAAPNSDFVKGYVARTQATQSNLLNGFDNVVSRIGASH